MSKVDLTKIGFDYGIKPHFMCVGDMEFSDLFQKAEGQGLLYLQNSEFDPTIAGIAFLFKNEEPAKKFFDNLQDWIKRSNDNGDAVAIDFIEHDKSYTISISPELECFYNRMIPKEMHDKVTPLFMAWAHFKPMTELSSYYLNFKKNSSKSKEINVHYAIGSPTNISKISEEYFVKTKFNFYNEDDIPQNSLVHSFNATRSISEMKPSELPSISSSREEIDARRMKVMKELLPLTVDRFAKQWLRDVRTGLEDKYEPELVWQAICNLTIFERLKQEDQLPKNFRQYDILHYLVYSYESFDAYYPEDDFFTEERIIQQLNNDQAELKNYLKKK